MFITSTFDGYAPIIKKLAQDFLFYSLTKQDLTLKNQNRVEKSPRFRV